MSTNDSKLLSFLRKHLRENLSEPATQRRIPVLEPVSEEDAKYRRQQ